MKIVMPRLILDPDYRGGFLIRLMAGRELAYVVLGICGLQAEIEFPSGWHEGLGWIRFGLGLCKIAFAFPWTWAVPDDGQCSGPTYGFQFHEYLLFIRWGKDHGKRDDPHIVIHMPWYWKHREHKVMTDPETHPYTYTLRNGKVQNRMATIRVETRLWTRYWLPHRKFRISIDVSFDDEVGERTGSWKGGTVGCSYDILPGERPVDTLRRMELERKF